MTSRLLKLLRDSIVICASSLVLIELWFLAQDRWFSEKFYTPFENAYRIQYETPDGLRVSYFPGPLRVQFHPVMEYRHVPNVEAENFTINSEGFRGQTPKDTRDDTSARIAVLGGSTAFGYGASSDAHTISAYLSQILNSVEVLNAAVAGYETGNEYAMTHHRLLKYSPDLVLAIHGWNDFHAFLRMEDAVNDEFMAGFLNTMDSLSHLRNITQDNPLTRIPQGLLSVLFPRSERSIRITYSNWRNTDKTLDRLNEVDLLADRFIESIRRMKNLADREGFHFVSFLQPDLNALAYAEKREFSQTYLQAYAKGYLEFCRLVLERAAAQQLPVYDLGQFSNTFTAHHFVDSIHFNDSGSKVAAEFIASLLVEKRLLSPKQKGSPFYN